MATTIPARHGAHAILRPGEQIKIINPSGHQVIDFWAFPIATLPTWMSMAQTRSKLMKLVPSMGDVLVDTRRQPVIKLVDDSSGGVHDMLFPPCDKQRYDEAGFPDHESCGGNLRRELAIYVERVSGQHVAGDSLVELESIIRRWGWTPEPLNLFMNVPWSGRCGQLVVKRPDCEKNDFVVLEALVECLVIMSACPNDLLDTNGGNPQSAAYEMLKLSHSGPFGVAHIVDNACTET